MILSASREDAGKRRFLHRLFNGTDTWLSTYIGDNVAELRAIGKGDAPAPAKDGELYPVAYLVEQAAGSLIHGHYHRADQFQVFVGGEGLFGKTPLKGVGVHYAGAFTPYAPITAGGSNLEYFTLRNGWDPGARWMPQNKDELSTQRAATGKQMRHALGEVGDAPFQEVVPLAADGLGAWAHRLAPGATLKGPDPAAGRGQYWLLLQGRCKVGSNVLGERDLFFVPPDEHAVELTAETAAQLVVVQFPKHAS